MAHFHQSPERACENCWPESREITFSISDDFDLDKIFTCGQCFRWSKDSDGSYIGGAAGHAARASISDNTLYITENCPVDARFWGKYFDMDTSYSATREAVSVCEYMRDASDFGAGIRILRQDPWETLCSFIFSQCNNLSRISGIIERFCDLYGHPIPLEDGIIFDFPTVETVAALTPEDLSPLRSGYRAPYVIEAARRIMDGSLDLKLLEALPYQQALAELKTLPGVGDKVANCVLLFGLGKREAFPIDVWIKRALQENFPRDFDPGIFGINGGIAQQYMFYYTRSKGSVNNE